MNPIFQDIKRIGSAIDNEDMLAKKTARQSVQKSFNVRKSRMRKESPEKQLESPKKRIKSPKPIVNSGQIVLDKFGSFRLMTQPEIKNAGRERDLSLLPGAPPPSKAASSGIEDVIRLIVVIFKESTPI